MDPDVLIIGGGIGGGIIGNSTAYYLAREGMSVTVIDKGDLGSINQRRTNAILRAWWRAKKLSKSGVVRAPVCLMACR